MCVVSWQVGLRRSVDGDPTRREEAMRREVWIGVNVAVCLSRACCRYSNFAGSDCGVVNNLYVTNQSSCFFFFFKLVHVLCVTQALLGLFADLGSPLCFDQLRTKDTLGYTVSCFDSCSFGGGEVGLFGDTVMCRFGLSLFATTVHVHNLKQYVVLPLAGQVCNFNVVIQGNKFSPEQMHEYVTKPLCCPSLVGK